MARLDEIKQGLETEAIQRLIKAREEIEEWATRNVDPLSEENCLHTTVCPDDRATPEEQLKMSKDMRTKNMEQLADLESVQTRFSTFCLETVYEYFDWSKLVQG